jgi:hypothetical protein
MDISYGVVAFFFLTPRSRPLQGGAVLASASWRAIELWDAAGADAGAVFIPPYLFSMENA